MGKTALEALAAGSALLTTRRGGIPEAAEGRAHIVDDPNVETLAAALEKLLTDDAYRTSLQDTAWRDFPFTATRMADDADAARAVAIGQMSAAGGQRR
jgi:glycosyltransferase involved in cell wall biosynthesis